MDSEGNLSRLHYDRLVLTMGAVSAPPPLEGKELPGVFLLRWMADGFAIRKHIMDNAPRSVNIIGDGYIGVEMSEAFVRRGLKVTVVEHSETLLRNMPPFFGEIIARRLRDNGVGVVNGVRIERILKKEPGLLVTGRPGFESRSDMVLVAAGIRPMTDLDSAIPVKTGIKGAVCVNRRMETSIPGEDISPE